LSLFLIPILELQHALLPPKCYQLGSVPQFYPFAIFTFRFVIEYTKEFGGASINEQEKTSFRKHIIKWHNCVIFEPSNIKLITKLVGIYNHLAYKWLWVESIVKSHDKCYFHKIHLTMVWVTLWLIGGQNIREFGCCNLIWICDLNFWDWKWNVFLKMKANLWSFVSR